MPFKRTGDLRVGARIGAHRPAPRSIPGKWQVANNLRYDRKGRYAANERIDLESLSPTQKMTGTCPINDKHQPGLPVSLSMPSIWELLRAPRGLRSRVAHGHYTDC